MFLPAWDFWNTADLNDSIFIKPAGLFFNVIFTKFDAGNAKFSQIHALVQDYIMAKYDTIFKIKYKSYC